MKETSTGSEAAALIARLDWAKNPLGEANDWPQSLRTAVDIVVHSPMPMQLLWGRELIQLYNDAFALLAGNKHPDAMGQPAHQTWPELHSFTAPIYDAVFSGQVRSFSEQRFVLQRNQRDTEIWLDLTYSPIRDERGSVAGILVTAIETNERRQFTQELQQRSEASLKAQQSTEQRLRHLNENLEERVAQRTLALAEANQRLQNEMVERERAEDALRHAQKMEAVGQLTGGIAHDFNNMLTGIIGSLDLMQRYIAAGRSDDIGRFADAAVASAHRAAALTHRLLAFSRRQSLDRRPLDPNQLVASLEDLFQRTKGAHITLKVQLGHDIWPVNSDASQLENALLNLVINARDAMPDGGELLIETANSYLDGTDISTPEPVKAGDYVMLGVRDNGTGMAPKILAKAFDPFFTTKPIGQGTGLGLSMIYGFAQQSGGHVTLHSEPGQGTCVRLYLPRLHGTSLASSLPASLSEAAPVALAGEAVVVVEDDPAVRMLVVNVLDELGYTAHQAADARTALPLLESDLRVDLLVTDVGLPGMNGRQLAEIARQHRPGLRILFMTGYAEKAAERQGFLEDGMDMVAKPFSIDVLATKIRSMISVDDPVQA
ncbi:MULTISPECIES: ATP-binding protein [unclassified Pseudomonas]|uniref:ATP-binding protein n=1 Tax=unclassified Pseudomonas TaxID=196821 RepID=UPI000C8765A7|nr:MULTISPECIES: ATP-binding protein [unclassified Pseudomonas]PMU86969.1 hybrid sensor histidine kinase/response regulator [Pseudomonas sp. GW704-F3]PMU97299.1 hybrid sensor histidine kinase/response regulator [Pseudomonas sp. GW704-F5]PMV01857.1 hybrid sensor histidine kinase/response regulator [Pseudomonas sp. MPBD4-3]PMV29545.1 hybrid sensor histidine kinase/response regulator [Pseudomonas sp. GW704-F2]